jgi:hypothetical protein
MAILEHRVCRYGPPIVGVSGQPDQTDTTWRVRDPENVRDLIETARTAKATSNTSAA